MAPYLRSPAPHGVSMLAAGRRNAARVSGKRKATGDITYAGNFSADDTVTINGTVFTAKATGAAGNQFNIGVDLTASLTALAAVLNASVIVGVAKATYSNVGGTKLGVSHDLEGTIGNAFTLAASVGTVSAATLTGGTDASKLDTTKDSVFLIITAAGTAQAMTLPNGSEDGHTVLLVLKTKGAGANATVSGVFTGGTVLTLDTAAKLALLVWDGDKWQPVVNTGSIA